jgi:hypothetical protein
MKSTRIVASGTFSKLYPLKLKVGDMGKYHPSKVPTLKVTNSSHVSETARILGIRSRI